MLTLQVIASPRHHNGQGSILMTIKQKEKRPQLASVQSHAGIPGNEAANKLAARMG